MSEAFVSCFGHSTFLQHVVAHVDKDLELLLSGELVIIVTPSILDDEDGGAYGYGYRPGTQEAKRLIGADSSR